jgi:YegS/Rv2252/BmrU family lipid kinase
MTKRALLLINRYSRRGKELFGQAVDLLDAADIELVTCRPKSLEELPGLIRRYQESVDLVIVGGGDGTLNMVVDSLVESQLPLGILPLGTANDLARTLHIPFAIPEACQVIAQGRIKPIDLGWVNGKYFFNVASLGLSVSITEKLTKSAKQRWGIFAYALSAFQAISQTRPFHANITLNGQTVRVKTVQIAIGNGRYYGGGMAVAADATIDDQRLDLYSLELEYWWQICSLVLTFPKGEHGILPWVRTLESGEIIIDTRKPHQINTDGEITATTPATFRVIPQALKVFVPPIA